MAYVRRKSSAFTRGKSRYRGVSGHSGRWEARIGTFGGRKNVCSLASLHLGSHPVLLAVQKLRRLSTWLEP